MLKLKIKKGDKVQVITGGDKGKKGTVIEVNAKALKIKIEGVKVQTHYDKKDGLLKKEGFIDYSNVQLVEKSAKATKEKKTGDNLEAYCTNWRLAKKARNAGRAEAGTAAEDPGRIRAQERDHPRGGPAHPRLLHV